MVSCIRKLMKDHYGIEYSKTVPRALMHRICLNKTKARNKRSRRRQNKNGSDAAAASPPAVDTDTDNSPIEDDSDNDSALPSKSRYTANGKDEAIQLSSGDGDISGSRPGRMPTKPPVEAASKIANKQHIVLFISRPGIHKPLQFNVSFNAKWSTVEGRIRKSTQATEHDVLQYCGRGCPSETPWIPFCTEEDWAKLVQKFRIGGNVDIRKADFTEWLSGDEIDVREV
jgi:hypothetical protein